MKPTTCKSNILTYKSSQLFGIASASHQNKPTKSIMPNLLNFLAHRTPLTKTNQQKQETTQENIIIKIRYASNQHKQQITQYISLPSNSPPNLQHEKVTSQPTIFLNFLAHRTLTKTNQRNQKRIPQNIIIKLQYASKHHKQQINQLIFLTLPLPPCLH